MTVSGSGYAPGEGVTVSFATATATATADAMGAFSGVSITIPNIKSGTQQLHATGALTGADAISYIYVGGFYPSAYPSAYYMLPGDAVSFTGSGFAPGETVNAYEGKSTTSLSSFVVAQDGSFKNAGEITVPLSYVASNRTIHLVGATSGATSDVSLAIGQFYPSITPSAYYALPGSTLTFSGSGFAKGETVNLTVGTDTTVVATATVDAKGMITDALAIPVPYNLAGGTLSLHFLGVQSGGAADVVLSVGSLNPQLTPASYYVRPGEALGSTATGFAPGEDVTLSIMEGLVARGTTTATADKEGNVTFPALTVPSTTASSLTVTATGKTSGATSGATIAMGSYYPYATLDSYYATSGTTVHVAGNSFAPGETVTVAAGSTSTTVVADEFGNTPAVAVVLPYGVKTGSVNVTLTGNTSGATTGVAVTLAPFAAQVDSSSYYAQAGSTITLNGHGFAPNENISVLAGKTALTSVTADAYGAFKAYDVQLPYGGTSLALTLTGDTSGAMSSLSVGIAGFYPGVQLSNYYAVGGTPVTVSGSGFASGESIDVTFGGVSLGSVTATAKGAFSLDTTAPYAVAGDKKVVATGSVSGATSSTTFTQAPVYTSFQLSKYAVAAGSMTTVMGSGFLPGESVTITDDRGGSLGTLSADANGTVTGPITIPASYAAGNLTLTASGAHSFTPQTVTMYVMGS